MQTLVYQAGDDGDHQAGWQMGTRFIQRTIAGDDILLDRSTGLIWPKDMTGAGGNGGVNLNWAAAITWANGLNFAGWTDWRLPNVRELHTLTDFSKGGGPGLNSWIAPFTNRSTNNKWSSTTHQSLSINAWMVGGAVGTLQPLPKINTIRVLAVRRGRLNG